MILRAVWWAMLCISIPGYGQEVNTVLARLRGMTTIQNLNERGVRINEHLIGIPLPPAETIGDGYYNQYFNRGNVLLYDQDKVLENNDIRYDILQDELEFKTSKGIRVLSGSKIKSFAWLDSASQQLHFFVNASNFKNTDQPEQTGFFEVVSEGETLLMKRVSAHIQKADYRPELAMGNRDNRIVKLVSYYAFSGDTLIKIARSKKKLLVLFKDHADRVDDFIRENSLDPDDENSLKLIFDFYNKLAAGKH